MPDDSKLKDQDIILDAIAMESFVNHSGYAAWKEAMDSELRLLISKIRVAPLDALPGLQGALMEYFRIVEAPNKVLARRDQVLAERRALEDLDGSRNGR